MQLVTSKLATWRILTKHHCQYPCRITQALKLDWLNMTSCQYYLRTLPRQKTSLVKVSTANTIQTELRFIGNSKLVTLGAIHKLMFNLKQELRLRVYLNLLQ